MAAMAPDAGKVLGAPQVAGTFVSPRGHTQNMAARSAGVRGVLKADLRFRFADGCAWEFEVPKIYRKTAERVVRELGGRVS